jgi:hypothetical protein
MKSHIVKILLVTYFVSLGNINAATNQSLQVLKVPKARSSFDISHDYHLTLLNMALVQAANSRTVPTLEAMTARMSQGRAMAELVKGDMLDVYWLGSDKPTDIQLRAIKIPTTRGLIGFRNFIIHKDSIDHFDKVTSLADLQQFIACQGSHWPDTRVLEEAKLPVITSTIYENLFKMLNAKRCDYFPRAYHDIDNELLSINQQYPDLVKYRRILFHYPFAVYFYTNKANEELAHWIEDGLRQLANEGAIQGFMAKHPLTTSIFPLNSESHDLYLPLKNSPFDQSSNLSDQTLWVTPKDFNIRVKPQ